MRRPPLLRVGGGILGVSLIVSVVGWFSIPADAAVPIHIGVSGVDRWVGRTEAALSVPVGMLVVLLVGVLHSRRAHDRAGGAEAWLILAALMLFALLNVVVVTRSLGQPGAGEIVLMLAISGLVLAVGLFCCRRRREGPAESAHTRRDMVASWGFIALAGLVLVITPVADVRGVLVLATAGSALVGLASLVVMRRATRAGIGRRPED